MPRIISEENKKNMINDFKNGNTFDQLSNKYGLKEITIRKHLKKSLTEKVFNKLSSELKNRHIKIEENDYELNPKTKNPNLEEREDIFYEILPLSEEIDFNSRKDLTSKPLKDFDFPNNTFMIVNNNIELEIKYIKDFPEFSFLSEADQICKTIKLFSEKKIANSLCSKNQKVIKIPNGEVFKLSANFLLEKGISKIILDEVLLSI